MQINDIHDALLSYDDDDGGDAAADISWTVVYTAVIAMYNVSDIPEVLLVMMR